MVGGGPFQLTPGQWTDDTPMALCLAESILDTGGMDLTDQLRRYLRWWKEGDLSSNGRCFDIGVTTRHQLSRFAATGEAVDPRHDDESAANGSLMRLAAAPIRWHGDIAEAAERSATRPVDACRGRVESDHPPVLGAMTAALIGGTPAEEVFAPEFWSYGPLHPALIRRWRR